MISIIIPVYNVEKYLKRCLDSVINQLFSDYEIICINNDLTDNSLQILETYKQIKIMKIKEFDFGVDFTEYQKEIYFPFERENAKLIQFIQENTLDVIKQKI